MTWYRIIVNAIFSLRKGGFGTKTGSEQWLIEKYKKERMNFLVKEMKKDERQRYKSKTPLDA